MKTSTLGTKVLNFLKKHTIHAIVPTLDEIIIEEISRIESPKLRQNYISKVVVDLYNDGELETAFYISNKYRNETQPIYTPAQ